MNPYTEGWCGPLRRRAGLWSGAFQRDPRPVFFAIMYGVRAAIPARPLAMKALGMWDWEVRALMRCLLRGARNMHRI